MFRRKKDKIGECEKRVDGLEEMYWFLSREVIRIEEGDFIKPPYTFPSKKDRIEINITQKEKVRLTIFSLIGDLIEDEILSKEGIEKKYGDVFAMSKIISNRIIKALGGEKDE